MKDYKRDLTDYKLLRTSALVSGKIVYKRASRITEEILGHKYSVHMGNSLRSVTPKEEILGHMLGFFSFTKISGSSIHKRKRKKKEKKKRGRKGL